MQDWRVAVVEGVLAAVVDVAHLAGRFLSRRFGQEAWPLMARVLRRGTLTEKLEVRGRDRPPLFYLPD